jgi:outer membrane protein OmpA-like peptidoglycan-associated protein
VPLVAQQTLYAIWRVQTTKADARVFFQPGKSSLRASQKLVLRDLVDSLRGKIGITLSVVSRRAKVSNKALGKARNTAVVRYMKTLGVTAKFVRTNTVSKSNVALSKKVNRVTVFGGWTNPAQ